MSHVSYLGYDLVVERVRYPSNNQIAIQLVAADSKLNRNHSVNGGEPIATATVCLPHAELAADETVIKNYSENTGILDWLIDAGIVKNTGRLIDGGFNSLPVVKVLPETSP